MKKISGAFLIVIVLSLVACGGKKGAQTASGLTKVNFEFDSASITSEMVPVMNANAAYLKKHNTLKVVVEGHCDERGTNEYNLALGDRRAQAGKQYLLSKGVGSERLRTVSYGEEKPLQKGHGESAWYLNRRDEFVRQKEK